METKVLAFRTWDDLVFAYRNKAYGAYAIRRAYSRRLLLGVGVSTMLMATLLLSPNIVSWLRGDVMPEKPVIFEYITSGHTVLPPPIIPRIHPPAGTAPARIRNTNTTIRVVTEPVDVPPAVVDTEPVLTDDTGTGDGGFVEGAGTVVTDIPVVETPIIKDPVSFAEVMPVYDGGMKALIKFIKENLDYPPSARRIGVDGTVFVSFVVNGDGTVSQVTVMRGIHKACDAEAARVISIMPGWKGGKQNGNPVAVRMVLPIKFNLQ
jgi:periplasmic protein TonB